MKIDQQIKRKFWKAMQSYQGWFLFYFMKKVQHIKRSLLAQDSLDWKLLKARQIVWIHSYSVVMLFPKHSVLAVVRQDTGLSGLSLLS